MDAKLREYRALKRRKELIEKGKKLFDVFKPKMAKEEEAVSLLQIEDDAEEEIHEEHHPILQPEVLGDHNIITAPDIEVGEEPFSFKKWTIILLIWLFFFIVFIKLEFGAVYFTITTLIGICLNTRTRPKKKGEVSAYSVFNQNCEHIDGSVTAEQLQRQYMFGGLGLF